MFIGLIQLMSLRSLREQTSMRPYYIDIDIVIDVIVTQIRNIGKDISVAVTVAKAGLT